MEGRVGETWRVELGKRFQAVRRETERRTAPLSAEDQLLQSMADASPAKWHRAHTSWFFEEFVLVPHLKNYQRVDPRLSSLFNSYYVNAGPRHERPKRGMLSRPSVDEVTAYRAAIDKAVNVLIAENHDNGVWPALIELGLHHEQQHQELILTDILHALAQNPLKPAYDASWRPPPARSGEDWISFPETIAVIGHGGAGFAYDNETPAHRVLLAPFRLRNTLVTNGEWLAFMKDGGYRTQTLWLSDGWATREQEGWQAPGYWQETDGEWFSLTLGGFQRVDPTSPVCHISYYEADAFARWAGKFIPTEFEWEHAAQSGRLNDAFGVVWQWTRSAYAPYPGFRAAAGAIGEYNGKFMINQMVLRGSSLATPEGHSRTSYRNFFYPASRWQFTGLRLSDDAGGRA